MTRAAELGAYVDFAALADLHGEPAQLSIAGAAAVSVTVIALRGGRELRGPAADRGQRGRPQFRLEALIRQQDLPALTLGRDTLTLPLRVGDATDTTLTLSELLGSEHGVWHVGLT